MKSPNWLAASAAAFAASETALDQRGSERSLRRARAARRRGGAPAGRARGRAGRSGGARARAVARLRGRCCTALMKLGAVAVPLDPRLTEPELDAPPRRDRAPALVVSDAAQVAEARRGRCRARRGARPGVGPLRDPHLGHRRAAPKPVELTYANHFWSAVGSAARIGVAARRPLALLPAASPHRRAWRSCSAARSTGPASCSSASTRTRSADARRRRAGDARLAGRHRRLRGCSTPASSSTACAACCSAAGRSRLD